MEYNVHGFQPNQLIKANDANEMDAQIKANTEAVNNLNDKTDYIIVNALFVKDGVLYMGLP